MDDFKRTTLSQKYAILQATLDYMIKYHSSAVVCDDEDPVLECYQREKIQAEKNYQEKNSSKLKYQLDCWLRMLERMMDMNYPVFIKEQTGFTIDLFENIATLAETFNNKTELNSKQEQEDCIKLIRYYEKTNTDNAAKEKLEQLYRDYIEKKILPHTSQNRNHYTIELFTEKIDEHTDMIKYQTISGGPKPKDHKTWTVASPDHHKRLLIQQITYAKTATTSVNIYTRGSITPIYSTEGIHNIDISWKDDSTIIIRIKNEYRPTIAVKKVSSPTETIYIEYLP